MMKKLIAALGAYALTITGFKVYIVLLLKHFKPEEFGVSLPFLAVDLLKKVDLFREYLGFPVTVSGAEGAGIRFGDGEGQHYLGRALDVILDSRANIRDAIEAAKKAGFTGIGIYPDSGGIVGRWRMHLDIRADRTPTDPATWAAVPQEDGPRIQIAMQAGLQGFA